MKQVINTLKLLRLLKYRLRQKVFPQTLITEEGQVALIERLRREFPTKS